MKNKAKEYYESLTDEELEQSYNIILDKQAELAFSYYFIKQEKIKRAMIKQKKKEKGLNK